ncbi:uncharacterized protein LOC132756951 [Ruditapes philippinarum]|uniref:uncharacterized protein LOC132756951 n=1 Tax=Ruditapes philippinarum TaxID=129788 RepID=UPI00295BEDDB|nr:uncharacterized protein LOC132756951 [Ruditapes philippinarum]
MSYDRYLDACLAKYQNPGRTKSQVEEVMSVFQDFRPKLEEFKTSPVETKLLLQLHGTVSVVFQGTYPAPWIGKTFNTPIAVWISDDHPNTAPAVFVTSSKYILYSYIDTDGRVYTEYIKQWNRNSTLLELISDLVEMFGQELPLNVYEELSSDDRSKYIEKLQLSNYMDQEKTKQDALTIFPVFSDIRGSFGEQVLPDGTKKQILSLSGTVPVVFQDSMDNIPLCIYLKEQHPYKAPIVYVKPASNMALNKNCTYVDQMGLVTTSYIKEWKHPNSDLVGLLQDLMVTFEKIPPLCKTPATVNILHQNVEGTYCSAARNSYPDNGSGLGRQPQEENSNNIAMDDAGQVVGRRK